jgi:hypothetical protein
MRRKAGLRRPVHYRAALVQQAGRPDLSSDLHGVSEDSEALGNPITRRLLLRRSRPTPVLLGCRSGAGSRSPVGVRRRGPKSNAEIRMESAISSLRYR